MAGTSMIAWGNDERFQILKLLGGGGMGVVYEALDKQRQGRVALKTLVETTAFSIVQFKSEFRALSDLSHPNLVSLYELFEDQGRWFFTMEFVPGSNFFEYVRPAWSRPASPSEETLSAGAVPATRTEVTDFADAGSDPPHDERLREAIGQITRGLTVLHRAGKLHCDIKPSNILVTPGGRVVMLDFGLVRSVASEGYRGSQPWVAGTLAYMSPEQAMGKGLTEASDWYAIGVMLYKALAGRLPFTGTAPQLVEMKLRGPQAAPSQFNPGVPADLERLVLDLLCPRPEGRPKGEEILQRIVAPNARARLKGSARATPFVGRADELGLLAQARRALEKKQPAVVFVGGQAGAGKTALLTRFAEQLREDRNYVVLSGRCREQESIPFKALDSIVDGLAIFLCTLSCDEVLRYLPRDADALSRLFPVLRTVPAFAESGGRAGSTEDPQRLRQWAFAALREMLSRIGDRYRLILLIDDAHWGDADSASLLSELLIPPDPPVLLLICAYRFAPSGRGVFLQDLDHPRVLQGMPCWNMEVGPLSKPDAIEIAKLTLGEPSVSLSEALAMESRGNAYFLLELAARAAERGAPASEATTLESLLQEKVQRLGGNAQRLLEMIAVGGQPVRQEYIFEAAGVDRSDLAAVSMLRAASLVTITGLRGSDLIDSYHDRVRETVLANLDLEVCRDSHLRLAQTLEKSPEGDPEMLAVHFEAGGDGQSAGRYYSKAGQKAAAATAFEHAARLFSRALALSAIGPGESQALRIKLADALANAGRSAEAARLYKEAAASAEGPTEFELTRKSGYHYAISGYGDEASLEFRKVLGHARVYFPKTIPGILAALVVARNAIWLRGLRFKIRDESNVPRRLIEKLEASQAALAGFGLIDLIRAVYFSSVSLWFALSAGEPKRLIYSLAMEASALASMGPRGERKAERMLQLCRSLVERYPSRLSSGIVEVGNGFLAFSTGQWRRAVQSLGTAETWLSEGCTGVNWELASIQYLRTLSQLNTGNFSQVVRSIPVVLKQAEDRGDLYLLNSLRGYVVPFVYLALDQPDAAERAVEQVENWRGHSIHIQHLNAFMSGVVTQLYQGRYAETWKYAEQRWSLIRKRILLFGSASHSYCLFTRIQAAIAAASVSEAPSELLKTVDANCRTLARLHPRYVNPMLLAIRAGMASVRRDSSALALFAQAATAFETVDMPVIAASCRFRLGQLTSGQAGEQLMQCAESDLRAAGLINPRRFAPALISGSSLPIPRKDI